MSILISMIRKCAHSGKIINFKEITKFNPSKMKCNLLVQTNVINYRNYSTMLWNKRLSTTPSHQNNRLLKQINCEWVQCKAIRTTNVNKVPAVFWVIARPILNLVAILGGRRARNWWKNLPENRKENFRKLIRRYRRLIYGLLGGLFGVSSVYYWVHIEETPITKRRRFMAFSKEKYNELSELEYRIQLEVFNENHLPKTHPMAKRVQRVVAQIIQSNLDIPEFKNTNWSVVVIDKPEIVNALVVGDGRIFVFTGMLMMCDNDDALGFVLSHEVAHSILSHGIEMISYRNILDIFAITGVFLLWTVLPSDIYALIATFLSNLAIGILFHLPWTRQMEMEADEVAMTLAAKSCFDVREGVAFWTKMSDFENRQLKEIGIDEKIDVEFLSTHPLHDRRADQLESLLPETLALRDRCNCHRLPLIDPIKMQRRKIEEKGAK